MSLDDYRIILDKISPYAKYIGFFNYGEPFLNKHILEMVSLANKHGIKTEIHSNFNPIVFDENYAAKLIKSGLSKICASIDGVCQESYSKYRVGGNYEIAMQNLTQLIQTKKKLKSNTPEIAWGFLINRFNENEVDIAKRIASDIGVYIGFNLLNVGGDPAWESSYHHDVNKLRMLQQITDSTDAIENGLLSKVRNLFSKIYGANKFKLPPFCVESITLNAKLPPWCIQPFNLMTINYNGNVLPCCTVYDDKAVIGNMVTMGIHDIWNSNNLKKCRDFLYHYNRKKLGSICEAGLCSVSKS